MQKNSKAVVFVGCGYPMGGVRFMAHMGCALFNSVKGQDFDVYFASVREEAQKGYWRIVSGQIPKSAIIKSETFSKLASQSVKLALKYEKLIIHTAGGYGQTKNFIHARNRLRKVYANRIYFVGTTHSYRIDSILRVPMSSFQYLLYRLFYRMIIFQCQYAADRFVGGNHLIRIGKGHIAPLGCESFEDTRGEIPCGIAHDEMLLSVLSDYSLFKFVYLAAFRPGKMHEWLIRAIAPALRKNENARLLLCGAGDGKVKRRIEQVIRLEGLDRQVLMPGQIERSEISWLLRKCNCAIVPSRAETFGHNFLEPMFAGLPVIGTDVGIGREVIKDGETGYKISLCKMREVSVIAEKLLKNPQLAKMLGDKAYELVHHDYTHEAVARTLLALYNKLLSER